MLSLAIASVPAELPRLAEPLAGAVIFPMVAAANMVEVAALVGDTARATILAALMGGQALTASELAYLAGVTRPTASEHLVKLVAARLLAITEFQNTLVQALFDAVVRFRDALDDEHRESPARGAR